MISYSDHIRFGEVSSVWNEFQQELFDTLQNIGQEFRDQVHTSGNVDYLVRFAENPPDISVTKNFPNYFLVLVTMDEVNTITKVEDEEAVVGEPLRFGMNWKDAIIQRFRDFRESLSLRT